MNKGLSEMITTIVLAASRREYELHCCRWVWSVYCDDYQYAHGDRTVSGQNEGEVNGTVRMTSSVTVISSGHHGQARPLLTRTMISVSVLKKIFGLGFM